MSFSGVGGAFWHEGEYDYSQHHITGVNRHNDAKLFKAQLRKDANNYYYKGIGSKIVEIIEREINWWGEPCIEITVKSVPTGKKSKKSYF